MELLRGHRHEWEEGETHYTCKHCDKTKLVLKSVGEDMKAGIMKNGKVYSVRKDRSRFFMPNEWKQFYKGLKEINKPLFLFLINTGCRINEAIHVRSRDIDFERNNVRLWKTKTKATKGETSGKPRTISISSELGKELKKLSRDKNPESYLFYPNEEIGKVIEGGKLQSINQLMKRVLKKTDIQDWKNFATHNIRKTHGMYIKALGFGIEEICLRLGHDYNTYLAHYGSADVFTETDVRGIKEVLGDLPGRLRR